MLLRNHLWLLFFLVPSWCIAQRAPRFVVAEKSANTLTFASKGNSTVVAYDSLDYKGVAMAIDNLCRDFETVTGQVPQSVKDKPSSDAVWLIAGTYGKSIYIDQLTRSGHLDASDLEGKHEKFIITTVDNPLPGVAQALVIAGSDMRGTIYGIYELSEQIGVSPWYYWPTCR